MSQLPTLYPPLGAIPAPLGTRLSAANPIIVTQGPHPKGSVLNAQDLDCVNDAAPIYAPCDGVVDDDQLDPACGQSLHVTRADGLRVTLCHLSRKAVTSGFVKAGTFLGNMGTTGKSTGPHLHWVVRWNDRNVYPGDFPLSTDQAAGVATAIVLGQAKRESPFVVDIPEGAPVYEDTVGTLVFKSPGVTAGYFGNPHVAVDHAVVQVKTAKVTGKNEWCLLFVKDEDVPKPRAA